ncbi:pantothenate transporter liz [Pyricularia oryzae 70-15]|uniref:Pantothenate transporter liz n=1 Tax=Pyricularia oryzae (strain 70-15 / ATCC MYA-4617 / FGSC 8958) TaxID=242507 RepID=G4N9A0_PYRO7|nr:pantothenate transporter liz [Pyricularia oryzae 70-15]EHA51141.1 pantothenate transporter liz [Pyricularia oryzae 70-15]KAI7914726.1 pantothenate transporter liz [Pyricularia oryzae]KAI7915261.1 pantothenate transporter liz [Pyricularia oryzae]
MGVGSAIKRNKAVAVIISVFDWYPSDSSAVERKLLRKLDLAILIFGSLSFFCRFLGQQNITNAYVSGMREDLNAFGNELNYYKMAYNTAYVLGQIPLMTLQTKGKLAIWLLPTLQISWAIIGFCQSTVTQNWHLYVLRALTGFLEASSFGGTHLILGSWYKNDEVFKRAGVWFMGNSLGSMFSGYLQAAAYKNLNGVMGRAGWRWLFIIHGVITLPISFLGYAVWPGLPISKRRWWMTEEEHALALKRIPVVEKEGITWKTFKYTLSRPMWWICVPTYVCLVLSNYWTTYMALWLRAEKYPIEMVNVLPTFIDLIRAFSSWLGTTLAGTLSLRGLWTFQFTTMFFACLMLSIWNIPNALKFVAFYLSGFSGMASPILYTWVNFTLKENYGERGLIISSMMTMGFSTSIWVPLLIFPAVEAPEWKKGYPASTVFQFLMYSGLMFGSWYMVRWKTRQPDPEREQQQERRHEEEVESAGTRTDDDEKHVGSSSALPAGPAAAVVAPAAAADDQAGRR